MNLLISIDSQEFVNSTFKDAKLEKLGYWNENAWEWTRERFRWEKPKLSLFMQDVIGNTREIMINRYGMRMKRGFTLSN